MATKNKSRFKMQSGKSKSKSGRKLALQYKRKKLVASKEAPAFLVPAILEAPFLITQPNVVAAEKVCTQSKAAHATQAFVQPKVVALPAVKKQTAIKNTEIKPLINTNTFEDNKPASNIDFNQSWLKFRKRMRSNGYDF